MSSQFSNSNFSSPTEANNSKNNREHFSLTSLSCKIDDFGQEFVNFAKTKRPDELYINFVKKVISYIPIDYGSKNKLEFLHNVTNYVFDFLQERKDNQQKVKIIKDLNGSANVIIVANNCPSIVDSVASLFSSLGLGINFMFYPTISCSRDSSGQLISISEYDKDSVQDELILFIKIYSNKDSRRGSIDRDSMEGQPKHSNEFIIESINKILHITTQTIDFAPSMRDELTKILDNLDNHKKSFASSNVDITDVAEFLEWISVDSFLPLGLVHFELPSKKLSIKFALEDILLGAEKDIDRLISFSQSSDSSGASSKNDLIMFGQLDKISLINKSCFVDYILIKQLSSDGSYKSGIIIFGLYGTNLYSNNVKHIPILRLKKARVLSLSSFPLKSYNIKTLNNIIESLPRETLLQISDNDLYCICMHIISGMRTKKLKLFVEQNWTNSFINFIIFLPIERLSTEMQKKICMYLSSNFIGKIINTKVTSVTQDYSQLFISLKLDSVAADKLNISSDEIEQDLTNMTIDWSADLLEKMIISSGDEEGYAVFQNIISSFPIEYKSKYSTDDAMIDIENLRKSDECKKIIYNLRQGKNGYFYLKIYSVNASLTLSATLPSIENVGFEVIGEHSFIVQASQYLPDSWIYEFKLFSLIANDSEFAMLKSNIEEALSKVQEKELKSDAISKLIVLANFNWKKVKLLNALSQYMHQTKFPYDKQYVQSTLVKHYKFSDMLANLFSMRFNPKKHSIDAAQDFENKILSYLDNVSAASEDQVLRNLYMLIMAITRTNYYQRRSSELGYISFKFDSSKVPNLPLPLPYAEIFVYSNDFEGVHLRGGLVSRGGLRWSDRGEDYRTEVLGLLKAQMTKNPVIVPVGSKGTFFVKIKAENLSKSEYMEKVINCYQNFLRGLLDLTDNLVASGTKIVKPDDTIIYDQDDPYLVVAADKGTATFSDYANQISKEYNFWLGDAFASGGSAGYDHKKMAITAKGAWISAECHFQELNIDLSKPFSVVGIGDMSGDVFGNGMLMSNQIKLVAAFNHMHIFLDPNPVPDVSFLERKRLFQMSGSKWSDYNQALISEGGAVFSRADKVLKISQQIQNLLSISNREITPDDLIKYIIKADVDLMWNGGIGTYIKSSAENNIDIGDKTNDSLRCNGCEIRAKIICEGGNLGVSQLGRIEYAATGGRINTDFIDNSAGVDCSDHEVNIKIVLNQMLSNNKITLEERNKILVTMTDEVANLVLIDNYKQNQAISLMKMSPAFGTEHFSEYIIDLEKEGILDRKVEFLPNKVELARMIQNKEKLSRPELAVLLSYSKMSVAKSLANASVASDLYLEKYLFAYFPETMRSRFSEEIKNHPLRNEIIRTVITNKMVNQMSGPIIQDIKQETGGAICDIARAHTIVCEIFDLDEIWGKVENSRSLAIDGKVAIFGELTKAMRRGISWFIRNSDEHPIRIKETIEQYLSQAKQVRDLAINLLVGETKERYTEKIKNYISIGVPAELASEISLLEVLVSAFDIIKIATYTKSSAEKIANLYFEIGDILHIDWLRKLCETQIDGSYWNRLSVQSLKDDLYDKQKRLITAVISDNETMMDLHVWLEKNASFVRIFQDFVEEIREYKSVNLNILILANKKLELFLRKLK